MLSVVETWLHCNGSRSSVHPIGMLLKPITLVKIICKEHILCAGQEEEAAPMWRTAGVAEQEKW